MINDEAVKVTVGTVVISQAGHDKGGKFAVIGFADELYALIADGKTRRVEKPKKKKLRHLFPVGSLNETLLTAGVITSVSTVTNRQLKAALKQF